MKKQLLKLAMLTTGLVATSAAMAQTRYIDDVFSNYTKSANIVYDSNRSLNILYNSGYPNPTVNSSPFITANLTCDVYKPDGDTMMVRPVVILLHTGSYIPAIANQQPTGNKNDSAIVELAGRFAKKGYVAVAMNYRLGWNALTQSQSEATEDLIQATYRGIQDVRNCVRYLRTNAATYGIDTSKIIVGGQGTGGYIALALGSVDKVSELESNIKFLREDFSPMVNVDTLGDWNGIGGNPYFNYSGDASVSGNVHMVFHYGGAMGDSTWLEANSLPVLGMQVVSDPFAPYRTGDVVVPGERRLTVIPSASGAGVVIPMANNLGVNNKINAATFTDAYTTRAMAASGGVKNLFPFYTAFPFDGAPWEWWNRTIIQNTPGTMFYQYPMPASGSKADSLALITNPLMSDAKGKAYCDTVVNFVSPRIAAQFDLATFTGVKEIANKNQFLSVYPNPASDVLYINFEANAGNVAAYQIMDVTGRTLVEGKATANAFSLNVAELKAGLYFVHISLKDGSIATKRVIIN